MCNQVLARVVAADALVLKHQAISIRNADSTSIVPYYFHKKL